MKYRESEIIRFIEPPLKGDKIKVYKGPSADKGFYYGIADEIILHTFVEGDDILVKEVLVIDLSETEFELDEINYFYLESRVRINRPEEEITNEIIN